MTATTWIVLAVLLLASGPSCVTRWANAISAARRAVGTRAIVVPAPRPLAVELAERRAADPDATHIEGEFAFETASLAGLEWA
jgi:hypothetical protein